MSDLEKNEQTAEQELRGKELYEFCKRQKQEKEKKDTRKKKLSETLRRIGRYLLYVVIAIGIVGGLRWYITNRPSLPPTTMEGHIESSPENHISTNRIPDNIQRHMFEHADGKGKPGIIIQYNCEKYSCEPDLVQKLTDLVKRYPDNVYLAPNNYDGKIILTKLGKMKILESFDEKTINDFIQ